MTAAPREPNSARFAVVTRVYFAQGYIGALVSLSEGHIVDTGQRGHPYRARLGLDVGGLTDVGGADEQPACRTSSLARRPGGP